MSKTMTESKATVMTRTLSSAFAETSTRAPDFHYGRIEFFRADFGVGVIKADDGRKYRFQRQDLINAQNDLIGQPVHFAISGLTPQSIIVLAGSPFAVFASRHQ